MCTVSHHELVFLFKKNPKLWRTSALGVQVIGNMENLQYDTRSGTHPPVPLGSMIDINANVIRFQESSPWLHDAWTGLSFLGAKCFSSECFSEATGLVQTASLQRHPQLQGIPHPRITDATSFSGLLASHIPGTDLLALITHLFM